MGIARQDLGDAHDRQLRTSRTATRAPRPPSPPRLSRRRPPQGTEIARAPPSGRPQRNHPPARLAGRSERRSWPTRAPPGTGPAAPYPHLARHTQEDPPATGATPARPKRRNRPDPAPPPGKGGRSPLLIGPEILKRIPPPQPGGHPRAPERPQAPRSRRTARKRADLPSSSRPRNTQKESPAKVSHLPAPPKGAPAPKPVRPTGRGTSPLLIWPGNTQGNSSATRSRAGRDPKRDPRRPRPLLTSPRSKHITPPALDHDGRKPRRRGRLHGRRPDHRQGPRAAPAPGFRRLEKHGPPGRATRASMASVRRGPLPRHLARRASRQQEPAPLSAAPIVTPTTYAANASRRPSARARDATASRPSRRQQTPARSPGCRRPAGPPPQRWPRSSRSGTVIAPAPTGRQTSAHHGGVLCIHQTGHPPPGLRRMAPACRPRFTPSARRRKKTPKLLPAGNARRREPRRHPRRHPLHHRSTTAHRPKASRARQTPARAFPRISARLMASGTTGRCRPG